MSGHSKWSTIKHKKALTDAKRGKIFSKFSKAITIAAREKGGNPETNPTLRDAIDRARAMNMPNDNVQRAIQKGIGGDNEKLSSVVFEAYGPGGVAIIMTGITDNNNRTSNEIKHLLVKSNAKWASPGSVTWAFTKQEDSWIPQEYTMVEISESDREKLEQLVELIDDHDDIQEVFTNEK